jgi:hypothetical protein
MEWILSKRWVTHTVPGQLLCAYRIFLHGCATSESIFYWQLSYLVINKLTLMEDMLKLWEHEINVWDEYKKEHLNLKAIIFYTINDNPTCLALTGQVKGKTWCVICIDQTKSIYLSSSSKLVYIRHRKFLPPKKVGCFFLKNTSVPVVPYRPWAKNNKSVDSML